MTIDELAGRAGTTTRNLRLLQTLGLMPAPRLVGRTGVYGDDDLTRLRAVLRLQDEGFSRAAIRALLDAWHEGRSLADVLGLPDRPPDRQGDATVILLRGARRARRSRRHRLALVPGPVADRLGPAG